MTMTKKRLVLIAAVPLTIAVALGVLAMLPPSPGVTKANFDRIETGMTLAEVEAIFERKGVLGWSGEGVSIYSWEAYDGSSASVEFSNDCVDVSAWTDPNETFLDKIRRWLHLP